jgi:hypothetical protein
MMYVIRENLPVTSFEKNHYQGIKNKKQSSKPSANFYMAWLVLAENHLPLTNLVYWNVNHSHVKEMNTGKNT